ncbi:hypothetical protein GOBAR_AA37635 [Gossypium barbadense]|uniref:Nudix hydrolase domain-containing protein n=1 Tax=Gossypium barbadense TaxID=3634 RepID=A0A2P5VW71_GOSBA|nr:hypothetical protein GOBAR_AA37635 [Gossypium barbadense]
MSTEAAKRSTTGSLTVKQRKTDELKPSPTLTAEPKKVIIKSADMKDDMQKEAVNIAISEKDFTLAKNLSGAIQSDGRPAPPKRTQQEQLQHWQRNRRMLARRVHPDKNPDDPKAADKFHDQQSRELSQDPISKRAKKLRMKACAISACGNFAVLGTAGGWIERFNLQSGIRSAHDGESAAERAIRETWEEAGVEVEVISPFAQLDIPLIGQVRISILNLLLYLMYIYTYVIFLAKLKKPQFSPGPESSECCLFELDDIPFDSLAFSSIFVTLNLV